MTVLASYPRLSAFLATLACDEVHLDLAYRWFCRLGLNVGCTGVNISPALTGAERRTERRASLSPSMTLTHQPAAVRGIGSYSTFRPAPLHCRKMPAMSRNTRCPKAPFKAAPISAPTVTVGPVRHREINRTITRSRFLPRRGQAARCEGRVRFGRPRRVRPAFPHAR
jgi:hypothetical protein